jgi:hypothetical protein
MRHKRKSREPLARDLKSPREISRLEQLFKVIAKEHREQVEVAQLDGP